jgi:hypothetical protein
MAEGKPHPCVASVPGWPARRDASAPWFAVARKLAVVLHAMWTDGTMFCSVEKEVLA